MRGFIQNKLVVDTSKSNTGSADPHSTGCKLGVVLIFPTCTGYTVTIPISEIVYSREQDIQPLTAILNNYKNGQLLGVLVFRLRVE